MSYTYQIGPEADSRRQAGEVPIEIPMRSELIARAVEAVLLVIAPAPARKPETMATVTDIATRQMVEPNPQATTEPPQNILDEMNASEVGTSPIQASGTQEEMRQHAYEQLAEVWAGMEPVDEIHLSAKPARLDPQYMPQLEQAA